MLVVEGAVPVLLPVELAELEVAAAVAGREESFASVYKHNIMISAHLSIADSEYWIVWSRGSAFTACSEVLVLSKEQM